MLALTAPNHCLCLNCAESVCVPNRHTTRSAHPEFLPEYPDRVLERVSKMGHSVKNFGFPTAVVCSTNAPDVEGGKAKQYLDTVEAKACAEWQPDIVILGPFGKHDALGQYPPPPGGARYDEPPTFSEEEFYTELKEMVQWGQGTPHAHLFAWIQVLEFARLRPFDTPFASASEQS